MNDTTVKRIVVQLELLCELTADDLTATNVTPPEVCASAEAFLSELPDDDEAWQWPEDRTHQASYLDRLLSRTLHVLGRGEIPVGQKDPVPTDGKWTGGEGPDYGPGKIPGFNS